MPRLTYLHRVFCALRVFPWQVRLKDRNPAPMQNLELLFEGTYQQLHTLADRCSQAHEQLVFMRTRLASGTRLLLLLLRLRFALSMEDAATLEAHLSPLVNEFGWEERTDAAVTHLLKTALSKGKDAAKDPRSLGPSSLWRPADASKLKKHIALVADRLHKGLRPTRDTPIGDGSAIGDTARPSGAPPGM